jgi:Fur family ferric uptake transcriptional regulator
MLGDMGTKCCHSPLSETEAREILAENGINKTKGKVRILCAISRANRPLSVPEIHGLLRESCDVSTVFRTVTQFKEKNLIREVNLDEGFVRYELAHASPVSAHHHHHVRCRRCGDIRNIEDCDLAVFERAIARLGYTAMEHRLEFTGLCASCAGQSRGPAQGHR